MAVLFGVAWRLHIMHIPFSQVNEERELCHFIYSPILTCRPNRCQNPYLEPDCPFRHDNSPTCSQDELFPLVVMQTKQRYAFHCTSTESLTE